MDDDIDLSDLFGMDIDDLERFIWNRRNDLSDAGKGAILQELKDRIKVLVKLAGELVRDDERAKSSWFPNLICALDSNHMYLDNSTTMQDTIDELTEVCEDD